MHYTSHAGDRITFTCTVDAAPLPDIVWLRNGQFLQTNLNDRFQLVVETVASTRSDIDDARRSTLTISNLTSSDSGSYLCRASNGFSRPAVLQPYYLLVNQGMHLDSLCMWIDCACIL